MGSQVARVPARIRGDGWWADAETILWRAIVEFITETVLQTVDCHFVDGQVCAHTIRDGKPFTARARTQQEAIQKVLEAAYRDATVVIQEMTPMGKVGGEGRGSLTDPVRWVFCVCSETMCWCDNMVLANEDDTDLLGKGDYINYIKECGPCERGEHRLYPPTAKDFMRVAEKVARG